MKVSYDEKSFLLDDKRIWLADGEIHYFRHPREGWREALLRAKRAGLNCISTYVAWNFHEPEKGRYDFSGDRDIGYFIDLIGDLGMFAMLRPGPYICSEWDCGGIPAWVCNEPGIRTREDDPLYMEYLEAWFDRLLPIISARQVTKGGPVVTIQNENEYCGGWDESGRSYIRKITGMFRKHGFVIPMLGCNVHAASKDLVQINGKTDPGDQIIDRDMILTYNCGTDVAPVYDLRKKQPYAPVIVTELWSGAQSFWGRETSDWPEKALQTRKIYDFTSSGAQVCYYMFEGGTNFGYWAGENIVTSYRSAYPVGDGGVLTDKYYMQKQVNHFITGFGDFLAESGEVPGVDGIQGPEDVRLVLRKSHRGAILFASLADGRKSVDLKLANKKVLTVSFGDVSATAVPVGFEVFPGVILDYGNLSLFTSSLERNLAVVYGAAGIDGIISINGKEYVVPVKRNAITVIRAGGATILAVDEKMARRYWDVEGRMFFGPDFAGEIREDGSIPLRTSTATEKIFYINTCAEIIEVPFTAPLTKFTPPALKTWKCRPCEELSVEDTGWNTLNAPRSHEDLGVDYGYLWYRAELDSKEDEVRELCFTNTPNRLSVFVNGTYCGTYGEKRTGSQRLTYGHPVDFRLENISVQLRKGKNSFVFLSDNQGHDYGMFIPKGITGPVYAGVRKPDMENLEFRDSAPVSCAAFKWLYCSDYKAHEPLPAMEFELELQPRERGYITLHDVPSWIMVNGEDLPPLSHPLNLWNMWPHAKSWCNYLLPFNESGGRFEIRISFRPRPYQYVLEKTQCFAVRDSGELENWSWKKFNETVDFSDCRESIDTNAEKNDSLVLLLPSEAAGIKTGHCFSPAFFETTFPKPEGEHPLFLEMGDMYKGQIYLNGHNIGRFWKLNGVHSRYYLPKEWLKSENRIVVFEEMGIRPNGTALVFGDETPVGTDIYFHP